MKIVVFILLSWFVLSHAHSTTESQMWHKTLSTQILGVVK